MSQLTYQLYSSRNFPPLDKTLRMLAGLGYQTLEGYEGLFEDTGAVKKAMDETGLRMPTCHFGLDTLENDVDTVLKIGETLELKTLFCPYLAPQARPADAAGYRALGARLQRAGKPYRDAGYGFGWHNHDFEFARFEDGLVPLDCLFEGGADLEWEADIAWIVRAGADPLEYIERYGGRISAVHVKDIAAKGECVDEDGWADVGHGVMDWRKLFQVLRKSGTECFVMEHDNPSDHERFARRSIAAARSFLEAKG